MRKALRPYLTAGVAVIGAGVLAVTPIVATPPDVKIVNPAAQQAASPLDAYVEAVEDALASLDALLGSALARPVPTRSTLGLASDSVGGYPGGDIGRFAEQLASSAEGLPAPAAAVRDYAAAELQGAMDALATGRIDLVADHLLNVFVRSGLPVAVAGPVVNAVGTTAEVIQDLVTGLRSGDPAQVLTVLAASPALIVGRVLHGGYRLPDGPDKKGQPWPGILPIGAMPEGADRVIAVERGTQPDPAQVFAFDRRTTPGVDHGNLADGINEGDPVDGREAADGRIETIDGNKHVPGLLGRDTVGQRVGGAGPSTLRESIRTGIHDVREGVRGAVKTVTGRGDDDAGSTGDDTGTPQINRRYIHPVGPRA